MENPENRNMKIPEEIFKKWQNIVNIIADIFKVPDALITRVDLPYLKVFKASKNDENPFEEGDRVILAGHYCEEVIKNGKKLIINNALKDEKWGSYPEIKHGLIAYLGFPLKWPNNQIFGTICIHDNKENNFSEDVVLLMKQFQELINSHLKIIYQKNKLSNQMKRINMFMGLSHEFRTPLNLMHTSLQMAKKKIEKISLDEDEKNRLYLYLSTIKKNNFRLLKLVNNLLDLYRIDNGQYNLNLQKVDIVDLVKKTTLSSIEYARTQHKLINFNSKIKRKKIFIDPFEIERIILNLLSNAFKNTSVGDEINVDIVEEGENILIIVKDTGVGISEKKHKSIFNKFYQVDNSLSRPAEGTGLGLSIVKEIVELHNGEICLKSKLGVGSEFIIKLPLKQMPEADEEYYNRQNESIIDRLSLEFSDIYN